LILDSFKLKQKLFSITRDNTSNNSTLYRYLYKKLKREFDDEDKLNRIKPLMHFHSEDSYIRYLAYIINLIYKAILKELKASTHKEAKAILDTMANTTIE
jgi:formate dehydrogenase maturation protein FdhE